jgi:L-threonylcarbamoyladenylate synthase
MPNLITPFQAITAISNHEIVALPTETVYGLFGLGDSDKAVSKVFQIKNRPRDNPLICHFWSIEQMEKYVCIDFEYIRILINELTPGPITFLLPLLPKSPLLASTSGLDTICCRIPNNSITLGILEQINIPLFGPSANTSTKVSGVNPEMINKDLGNKIAGIVDGGSCQIGLESTIISCLDQNQIRILRPGYFGKDEIQKILTKYNLNTQITEEAKDQTIVPGTKYKHYSPNCHIIMGKTDTKSDKLVIGIEEFLGGYNNKISFGSNNDLDTFAHNLFSNLQKLDDEDYKEAIFDLQSWEYLTQSELSIAKAIVNRLGKVFE